MDLLKFKKMPYRFINIDLQIITLNTVSGMAFLTEYIRENSNNWTVGILIISVALLNGAKAYKTFKETNKKNNAEDKDK